MALHLGDSSSSIITAKETPLTPFITGAKSIVTNQDLEGLTILTPYNFCYKYNLQSVSLPEGLTKITKYNFYCCPNLKYIRFPSTLTTIDTNYTFQYLNQLEILDLSKINLTSLYNIGNYCYKLKTINLPKTITSVNNFCIYTFNLKNITIEENNNYEIINNALCTKSTSTSSTKYLYKATIDTIEIPDHITHLYNQCFSYLNLNTDEITIPNTVTNISNNVFYWTNNLKKLNIPSSITSLSNGCIYYLKDLEELTIDNFTASTSSILTYYFNYLPKLKVLNLNKKWTGTSNYSNYRSYLGSHSENGLILNLGDNVNSLPNYFLYSLDSGSGSSYTTTYEQTIDESFSSVNTTLYRLNYDRTYIDEINWNQCSSVGQYAFFGCKFNKICIPPTITNLGNYAFNVYDTKEIYYDTNLTNSITTSSRIFYIMKPNNEIKLTIGPNVTSIPVNLFGNTSNNSYSTKMKYVYFTKDCQITELPSQVFYNCNKLSEIIIPKTITTIGSNAFYNCSALSKIYYEGTVDEYNTNVTKNDTTSYFINAEIIPYSECIHNEGEAWRWENNNISLLPNLINKEIIKQASPCSPFITTKGSCAVCNEVITYNTNYSIYNINYLNWSFAEWKYYSEENAYKLICRGNYNYNTTWFEIETLFSGVLNFDFSYHTQYLTNYPVYIYINDQLTYTYRSSSSGGSGTLVDFINFKINVNIGDKIKITKTSPNSSIMLPQSNTPLIVIKNIAFEHTFSSWTTERVPTCEVEGLKYGICDVCGERVTETIPALGHNIIDGICDRCGKDIPYIIELTSTTGYTWALHTDGYYYPLNGGCQGNKHGTSADFTVNCSASGTLSFDWAQSTESGADYLIVFKNDSQSFTLQNQLNQTYTTKTMTVNAGDKIRFRYKKDGSVDSGWDQIRIKNICIIQS